MHVGCSSALRWTPVAEEPVLVPTMHVGCSSEICTKAVSLCSYFITMCCICQVLFSNKFQIFHPFFLLYLFFFQFSGANPLFSPLKWMQKLGLSHNYFYVLYIKTKLIIPFLSPEVNLFFVKFEY